MCFIKIKIDQSGLTLISQISYLLAILWVKTSNASYNHFAEQSWECNHRPDNHPDEGKEDVFIAKWSGTSPTPNNRGFAAESRVFVQETPLVHFLEMVVEDLREQRCK